MGVGATETETKWSYPNLEELRAEVKNLDYLEAKDQVLKRLANYISKEKVEESQSGKTEPEIVYVQGRRCCHDSFWYHLFTPRYSNYVTHHHYHRSTPKTEEERNEEKEKSNRDVRIVMGMIFAGAAIGMSYVVGLEARKMMETREDERIWNEFNEDYGRKDLPVRVGRFFAEQKEQAYVRLAIKVAIFCSVVIGGVGALAGSNGLILAGVALTIASICGLVFNYALHKGDEEKYSQEAARLYQKLMRVN